MMLGQRKLRHFNRSFLTWIQFISTNLLKCVCGLKCKLTTQQRLQIGVIVKEMAVSINDNNNYPEEYKCGTKIQIWLRNGSNE